MRFEGPTKNPNIIMTTALRITKKAFSSAVVGMTILWSIGASAVINPLVAAGAAVPLAQLASGDLMMADGAKAGATVYLYAGSKRYPFPNQRVYASWYGNDFSKVKRISPTDLGSIAWGDNMLYRPGSRLIKVPDDPKVYAVLPGGKVAWVKDEAAAAKFYGAQWAKRVDDLLASLFVASYTNDPTLDLTASTQYPAGTLVKVEVAGAALSAAAVKYYYVEGGKKREVPEASLAQFRTEFAISVTEADIASLAVGTAVGSGEFVNPVAVQEGTTVPGATGPAPTPAGAVTVSLAADSPSARIFDGSAFNPVLKLDLKAGSSEAKITSFKFLKRGGATNSNITGIRVIDSKGVRHGNVVTSINEDNTFTLSFPSAPIVVPANGSETATIQMNFNTSNNGVDIGLSVEAVGDVGTDNASVSGTFPTKGFLIDVKDGASIVTTVTFDLDAPANNTSVQMNAAVEVFNFTLRDSGSFEKTWFEFIDLYNNGSVTDSDVKDWQLLGPNGDVIQTIQQKDKHVIFDLKANPYSMDKGATKSFKVKVTPVTGATRTIDMQLQNDYDLLVKGQTTAHYILATADGTGTNDSTFPVGDISGYTDMTLASGTLTLDKASDSPTTNYAVGESDVVLGKYTVKASGEDLEIRRVLFSVYTSGSATTSLAGSIFIKSGGQTLYSTAFARSMITSVTTDTDTTANLSTYLTVKAGETKDITIVGSINSTATSSDNYGANLDVTQLKRLVTGDLTDPSVSVVNTSARNVKAAALEITDVSMAASGSYKIVSGTNGALVGKYTLNASSGGEDARVNSMFVTSTVVGNSGDAVTDWSNLRMYRVGDDGTETLLSTSNNTDTGAATMTFTFTTPQVISKTDSDGVEFRLRANLAGSGVSSIMISKFAHSGTGADVVGNTTGNAVTETASGQGTMINTVTGGTLKIALDTAVSPAINALINVGQTDYTLGAVTLKAEDETQKVTGLELQLEGTSSSTDVRNVRVYLDGASTALVSTVAMLRNATDGGGYVIWLSPDKLFEIEQGVTRKLKFVADVSGTGIAKLGNDIRLDVDQSFHVTSTGKFTNTTATRTLLSNNAITHTIQPFSVTIAEASPAYPASNIETNISTGTLLAKFKWTNSGAVSVTTTQFRLFNNGSCTFDSIAGAAGTEDCNARASVFSLKTSAENSDSTTNLVSTQNTYEAAGVINWLTTGSTTLATANANLVTAGGRYRTFGIYISTTPDGYAAGSNWQFSVATEGDMTFDVAESSLGYDGNTDGDQIDGITGLKARGKPSLPQVTDKTT